MRPEEDMRQYQNLRHFPSTRFGVWSEMRREALLTIRICVLDERSEGMFQPLFSAAGAPRTGGIVIWSRRQDRRPCWPQSWNARSLLMQIRISRRR